MSTYEPGKLYLYERAGKTEQAVRDSQGYFRDPTSGFLVSEGENARPAIVLDPEDADVKAVLRRGEYVRWHTGDPDGYVMRLADKIRAQVTQPEPPMEEPTELLERVTDDDGNWIRWTIRATTKRPWVLVNGDSVDSVFKKSWSEMVNPRPYEG